MGGSSWTDPLRPPRPGELSDAQRSNPRVLRPAPTKSRQVLKIAILDDYQNVALSMADWSTVAQRADITVFSDHIDQADALIEGPLPFDVICVMRERTPLRRDIIERLPRLRFIASTGPRNISIDMVAANERGIVVANTGYRSTPTIELTWALILASTRHLVGESNSIRAGGWQTSIGHELDGRILGVLGLGNVGGQVARIGRAFGMKIIAWSQNLTAETAAAAGAELATKDELFWGGDGVTSPVIPSERTRRGGRGRRARDEERTFSEGGCRDDPRHPERTHPRPRRRCRVGAHETDGAVSQRVARPDRRRASAHRGLARTGHRGSCNRRFR